MPLIDVIIPAYNEEKSIALVLHDIPKGLVSEVIVVDNNSTDDTGGAARRAGATVLKEARQGYGQACLTGIAYALAKPRGKRPEILVFLDGDYSDHPEQISQVLAPLLAGTADLVIGSRALGRREPGAMLPQQVFGNWLATSLLRLFYGARFTDLGPFRAISTSGLEALQMRDRNYGWTVEMQLKAAKRQLRCVEVAVDYRKRIGFSKVSGTLKGTLLAGYKIILTIFRYL